METLVKRLQNTCLLATNKIQSLKIKINKTQLNRRTIDFFVDSFLSFAFCECFVIGSKSMGIFKIVN